MTGFGKGSKGQILYDRKEIAVSTLASEGVQGAGSSYALTEDFRILKIEYYVHATGLTAGEEIGLILGLADGELSDAEIQECLQARPADANDHVPLERAHRPVWPVALLRNILAGGGTPKQILESEGVWDKRWTFSDTEGWKWFVYNITDTAPTGGITVRIFSKVYGVWVK